MRPGLKTSIIVHLCVFLLLFFGLPTFNSDRSYEAQVVTVEVLPISELTNVKPKQAAPKVPEKKEPTKTLPKISKPEPKHKPEPQKVKVENLPKPTEKKEEPKKEAIKIKKEEKLKPEEKKPEEKKEQKKEKSSEDDFAAVIKSVEEGHKQPEEKEDNKEEEVNFDQAVDFLSNAKDSQYKEGIPLSISEKDAIRQQIMKNWTVPSGAKDVQNTVVTIRLNVQPDGTISKSEIENKARYNSDPFFRAMADSAIRAVYKSSPLQNLPAEKYDVKDGWRELEINFDPREMVY